MGEHRFRYSLVPFTGTFQSAGIVQKGYEFNKQLNVVPFSGFKEDSLIQNSFFSVSCKSVIIDTVKKSEDGDFIILRVYESFGGNSNFDLNVSFPLVSAFLCNVLEEQDQPLKFHTQNSVSVVPLHITPFKFLTIKLQF